MDSSSFSDDIRRYLSLLWQWAWLLALATILAAAGAFFVSKRTTPVYRTTATVLINEAPGVKSNDYASLATSERLAQTYAQLMTKTPVLEGVVDALGLDLSAGALKGMVSVKPVRDTQLIEISVEDTDPERAARIANSLVAVFRDQNEAVQASRYAASKQSLETQMAQVDQQITLNGDALLALNDGQDNQAERDRLQAMQAQYRQTYADLLQSYEQLKLAESQSTADLVQLEPATVTTVYPYEATTTMLVRKTSENTSIVGGGRLTQTYAELMTKSPILEGIIKELGLSLTTDALGKKITVKPLPETDLIEVRVKDIDQQQALAIADTLVKVFTEQNQALQSSLYDSSKQSLETQLTRLDDQIQSNTAALEALGDESANQAERDRLETTQAQYRQMFANLLQSYEAVRLSEAQSTSNIVQAEPAMVPQTPIRPRTMTNTALAGVVGLMLAVGVIFLIEALDDTLGPDDITQRLGLPVLGVISHYHSNGSKPVSALEPRSPVSEAYRSLRTNIQFAGVDRPLRRVVVTSPSPEDGKSTVAANLAVTLAQGGKRVALIDADLRRPRVHKVLGLHNRQGMSALFVQSKVALNGHLQDTEVKNLYALTTGILPPNPSELLGSEKMEEIMEQIGERVDILVIDTPPVMAVTDAAVLSPQVDGVVLVVKPGVTRLGAASQSVEQLQRVGANILGVVLNDVEIKRSRYKYSYYNGYYYAGNKYYSTDRKGKEEG